MRELDGEKLDVITWSPEIPVFIANALSPAQVVTVELDEAEGIATVVVPDRQLSLAIGKEGQNARLAAKLTGWRIDIKNAAAAEEERLAKAKSLPEVEEAVVGEELAAELPAIEEPALAPAEEAAEPLPLDTTLVPPETLVEPKAPLEKPQIRFAEDVLRSGPTKPVAKAKRKKKKETRERSADDGIKLKKRRRGSEIVDEQGEEYDSDLG